MGYAVAFMLIVLIVAAVILVIVLALLAVAATVRVTLRFFMDPSAPQIDDDRLPCTASKVPFSTERVRVAAEAEWDRRLSGSS